MIETLYPELIVAIVKKETYKKKYIESWHEKWNEAKMTNYHYKSENYDYLQKKTP